MLKELHEVLVKYQRGDLGRNLLKEWLSKKPCEKWVLSLLKMDPEEIIALEICDRLLHNIETDVDSFNSIVIKMIIAIEAGCIEKVCFYKATKLSFSDNEHRVLDIAERVCSQASNNKEEIVTSVFNERYINFLETVRNGYINDYYMLNKPDLRKSILEISVSDVVLLLYDIYYINQYGSSSIPGVRVQPGSIMQSDIIYRVSYITGFLTGKSSAYIRICGQKNNYYVCLL